LFERLHQYALDHEKRDPALARDLRAAAEVVMMRPALDSAEKVASAEPLPKSYRERFEAMCRRQEREFEARVEQGVEEEAARRLNEISLPQYAKELEDLEFSIKHRKGVMDRATYRKVLACLHVERLVQVTGIPLAKMDQGLQRRYDDAFNLFADLEKVLLDEKESPTEFRKMPRTAEELRAMRRRRR
jgi:hypothetical protein